MGWKKFQQHFQIEHIVHIIDNNLCIGSPYSSILVSIDMSSGTIKPNQVSPDFLQKYYPNILTTPASELIDLLAAPDQFSNSTNVYTYNDGIILEKLCENTNYPNVTHDGILMYENTFSTDKNKVVGWAKRNAELLHQNFLERIEDTERNLKNLKKKAQMFKDIKDNLEEKYPDVKI